jgi:hypothetical protein
MGLSKGGDPECCSSNLDCDKTRFAAYRCSQTLTLTAEPQRVSVVSVPLSAVLRSSIQLEHRTALIDQVRCSDAYIQQAAQIRAFRAAWKEAGHTRTPRISDSRSIFALLDDRDRGYFGRGSQEEDKIGFLDENTRAIFGRSYAAEPDILIEQLRRDEAIAEADTLLLTIPNQLGTL